MLARKGFKDATTDGDVIAKWFNNGPINIGVRTGTESGLVVLDIDPEHGGSGSLKKIGNLPSTPRVQTGSGGEHYFFIPLNKLDHVVTNKLRLAQKGT